MNYSNESLEMLKYSLLILIALATTGFVFFIYQLKFISNKAWMLTALTGMLSMIIFNTYLTALPIVVYNMNSIIGIKVITFPIEDIGYLVMALVLLPPLFEKLSDEERKNNK